MDKRSESITNTIMSNMYDVVKRILPLNRNDNAEIHKVEPYVYCQSIVSDDNPICPGRASNSWLTGTAGSSMVAFCEHFFGVKPTLQGLKLDPCLPSEWKEIKIKRVFRDQTYNIKIINKSGRAYGVKSITMNGEPISGNILPLGKAKDVNEVTVEL